MADAMTHRGGILVTKPRRSLNGLLSDSNLTYKLILLCKRDITTPTGSDAMR